MVTENGPAPDLTPRSAPIEIIESILVHLEVQRWSGKLAGTNARSSDIFTSLKRNGEWAIIHKLFHWHDQ
jgi:hypothetical protein